MPRLGRTHDRILDAYAQITAGAPADRALAAIFKKSRDLGPSERAKVSEVVYGIVRAQRTIDDRLDRALKVEGRTRELLEPPTIARLRVLTYFAICGSTLEELNAIDAYAAKRIPKIFQRIVSGKLPPVKRSAVEELAVACSLPDFVVARLADRLGIERAEKIARALMGRAPVTLRVNRMLATRAEAAAEIAALQGGAVPVETSLSPDGLILAEHADLPSWPLFERGAIEPQDEGSQLLALATGAAQGEAVLDACAGAGGKTLALAAMMNGSGHVVALDPDAKKLEELKKRARRAQLTNVEAIEGRLEALPDKLRGTFDRVLVDAPCTGSGAWRRHPDARWRVTEPELLPHAAEQKRMIASAVSALKSGGVLVYATCSVLAEENEDVVDAALAGDARIEPALLESTLGAIASRLQLGPHGDRARIGPGPSDRDPDGFFVAVMRRR